GQDARPREHSRDRPGLSPRRQADRQHGAHRLRDAPRAAAALLSVQFSRPFIDRRSVMKLMSITMSLLVVSLTAVAVCGMGTLAVRAGAVSTQKSIELLRMQIEVTRLHEKLLRHSQERLAAQAAAVLPRVPRVPAPADQDWPNE